MTIKTEVGRVVWHDLMTNNIIKARHFYAELLDWEYHIEHTSDFVWKPGEAEYPLIIANGEAHGGFVDPGRDISSHWIVFVAVKDVDVVTIEAKKLGGTIDRNPFDIPGVGRTAAIRDPQGATIYPYIPTHNFPPPSGTFLWDELITNDIESAKRFYGGLFGWKASESDRYTIFKRTDDIDAAGIKHRFDAERSASWVTYLATHDIDATVAKAKTLGAIAYREGNIPKVGRFALLTDPTGAIFGLVGSSESRKL